jgi:voltage-gated potassium channel
MRRARLLLAVAAAWIAACGALFSATQHCGLVVGLYWAVTTATTVGYGDITPHSTAGQLLAIGVMLTAVPLLAAVFALATSSHLGGLVRSHIDVRLAEHHQAIHERLDDIERKAPST